MLWTIFGHVESDKIQESWGEEAAHHIVCHHNVDTWPGWSWPREERCLVVLSCSTTTCCSMSMLVASPTRRTRSGIAMPIMCERGNSEGSILSSCKWILTEKDARNGKDHVDDGTDDTELRWQRWTQSYTSHKLLPQVPRPGSTKAGRAAAGFLWFPKYNEGGDSFKTQWDIMKVVIVLRKKHNEI